MIEAIESIKLIWENYSLTTISLVLYWVSLVWLILYKKEKRKHFLLIYSLVIPVMVVAVQLAGIMLLEQRSFDKAMYLLPTAVLICYVGTEIAEWQQLTKKTWILIVLYAIIIQTGMLLRYDEKLMVEGMNTYKVTSAVWKVAECIGEDSNINEPYVLAPDEIACQIQECDYNIRAVYDAEYDYSTKSLDDLLIDMDSMGCNCLIVKYSEETIEYMSDVQAYRLVAVVENEYVIYARI